MKRPSHWILLSVVSIGASLWATDRLDLLTGGRDRGPKVVRPENARPPQPAPAVALRGRVIDPLGWPVAGAEVASGPAGTKTAADGSYVLEVAGLGPHDLRISAAGHQGQRETAIVGEAPVTVLPRSFSSERDPSVELPVAADETPAAVALGDGFLRSEAGAPVTHAVVTVLETGVRAVADEVGHYQIALPKGPFTLTARSADGLVARIGPLDNELSVGKVPLDTTTMTAGRTLNGGLRDASGAPCAKAHLVVRGEGMRLPATTDADGSFTVVGLTDGVYEIEALPFEGWLGTRRDVLVQRDVVDLDDLTLVAERPRRLQVVDAQTRGLGDLLVVVSETESGRRAHGRTNEDGFVALSGLAARAVTFRVFGASDGDATSLGDPLEVIEHQRLDGVDRLVVRRP